MRRIRPVVVLPVLAITLAAAPVAAQPAAPGTPRVEVGLDVLGAVAQGGADLRRAALAPRLTVNVSPRTAFSISADAISTRHDVGESWGESRGLTVEMRRAFLQQGRLAVTGKVGGGLVWSRSFVPEQTLPGRDGPVVFPAVTYTSVGPAVTIGLGFEQRVAPRLSLRQEIGTSFGEDAEIRALVGMNVPFGRFADRFEPPLTRSGRAPDSLANGTTIGALTGAAAMGSLALFAASFLCDGDCNRAAALAVGAAYGAGAGAVGGAMLDSFRE